jgi:hypothetical protein
MPKPIIKVGDWADQVLEQYQDFKLKLERATNDDIEVTVYAVQEIIYNDEEE